MKNVCILSGRENWRIASPFTVGDIYDKSYQLFSGLAAQRGVKLYLVGHAWYDSKKKIFKHGWTFEHGQWKMCKKIRPNLIHDKLFSSASLRLPYIAQRIRDDYPVLNDPEFALLIGNKFYSSLLFPKYSKAYHRASTTKQLRDVIAAMKGTRIVIKEEYGTGGKAVQILKRAEAKALQVTRPVIVQEFIDSSKGIPDIVQGYHDLRITFVDDRLIYGYVRTPAPGSLLANVAQGGTMKIIDTKKLPQQIWPLVDEVLNRLQYFSPKIFAIDILFDTKQQPWIVELTPKPGIFFDADQKKWQRQFYIAMINSFKRNAV